jgi:hypothetical protein
VRTMDIDARRGIEKMVNSEYEGLTFNFSPTKISIENQNYFTQWLRFQNFLKKIITKQNNTTQDRNRKPNRTNVVSDRDQQRNRNLCGLCCADQDNLGQRIEPIYKVVLTGHSWKGPILLSVSQMRGENGDKGERGNPLPKTYLVLTYSSIPVSLVRRTCEL